MMAFITSTSIETAQLLTERGYFELDDIILNVFGAVAGYLLFILFYYPIMGGRKRFYEENPGVHPGIYGGRGAYSADRGSKSINRLNEVNLFIIQLLPLLLVIQMIFKFSADTGDESSVLSLFVTEKLISIYRFLSGKNSADLISGTPAYAGLIITLEPLVRKAAHVSEYAILGFFSFIFFYCRKIGIKLSVIISLCLCLFIAISE